MIPCVRFKDTVKLVGSPGGVCILAAFDHAAKMIYHNITVTSGADGTHSGPDDPHFKGNALDGRTHDLPDPDLALKAIQDYLGVLFFAWIESRGLPNEHIHAQVSKGTVYPPPDLPPQADLSIEGDV